MSPSEALLFDIQSWHDGGVLSHLAFMLLLCNISAHLYCTEFFCKFLAACCLSHKEVPLYM